MGLVWFCKKKGGGGGGGVSGGRPHNSSMKDMQHRPNTQLFALCSVWLRLAGVTRLVRSLRRVLRLLTFGTKLGADATGKTCLWTLRMRG